MEILREHSDPYLAQLEAVLPIAYDNPIGNIAWFRNVRLDRNNPSFTVWQYSHMEYFPDNPREQRAHYHYQRWDSREPFQIEYEVQPHPNPEFTPPKHEKTEPMPLTVPNFISSMIHWAQTPEQLGHIVDAYVDWAQTGTEPFRGGSHRVVTSLASKFLTDHPALLTDPNSPVIEALTRLTPAATNYAVFTHHMSAILGGLLIDKRPRTVVAPLPAGPLSEYQPRLLEAIVLLDQIGAIDKQIWFSTGVQAGAVFSVPGMLEATLDGLQDDTAGQEMLARQKIATVEGTLRLYINRLFDHYAADTLRDQERIQALRTGIVGPAGTTRLDVLVHAANGATRELNARLTKAGHQPLPELNTSNWAQHVGEAIIRIMSGIRHPDLNPEIAEQQIQEDAMHASLLELLDAHLRDATRVSLSDLQLRYPNATPAEIEEMMGGIRRGVRPAEVDGWYRARRRAPGTASGWNVKRRGYGLLS